MNQEPDIIDKVTDAILQPIVYLLFALAIAYFLWGVMKFIQGQGSETGQEEGKQHMLWGIIGLAIMVSVLGILNFVQSSVSFLY